MQIYHDRIQRAQTLMKEQGMIGLMIMNHDDYTYFFGEVRIQPRAILPASGPPIFICFKAEEPELKNEIGGENIKLFSHVSPYRANNILIFICPEQMLWAILFNSFRVFI